jgi:4-hydroxybenzoyl-CoA reductase subunit beta
MMRLPAFSYLAPRTVEDAVRAMADAGPDGMLVAGGTDLYPNMKRRQFEPKTLVGLRAIKSLRGVGGSAREGMRLGACLTLSSVAGHPEVAHAYAGVATAAGLVSSPQLRNMGTLGGNVCVDTRCNYYNQTYEWRKAIGFCMKKEGDICLVAPSSPRCWAVSSSDTAPTVEPGRRVRWSPAEAHDPIGALFNDDGIQYCAPSRRDPDGDRLPPAEWRSVY